MSELYRESLYRGSEASLAAVIGGAVTREQLLRSARIEGRGGSPLVRSLLAQSLPAVHDLALAYGAAGTTLRLDGTLLQVSPHATRLIDIDLMRHERCVPVEILDDLCILAVSAGRAARAAAAIREALQRDVLPVVANSDEIDALLANLQPSPSAVPCGPIPRRDSPVHTRFRELVLEDALVNAVSMPEPASEAAVTSEVAPKKPELASEKTVAPVMPAVPETPRKTPEFDPVRHETEVPRQKQNPGEHRDNPSKGQPVGRSKDKPGKRTGLPAPESEARRRDRDVAGGPGAPIKTDGPGKTDRPDKTDGPGAARSPDTGRRGEEETR